MVQQQGLQVDPIQVIGMQTVRIAALETECGRLQQLLGQAQRELEEIKKQIKESSDERPRQTKDS